MELFYKGLDAALAAPQWVWAVAGLVVMLLIVRSIMSRYTTSTPASTRRPQNRDVPARELQQTIARVEAENATLTNFFLLLPDFTKEINSGVKRRAIAPLLIKIIDRLFSPSQILVFVLDERSHKLVLVQHKGLAKVEAGYQIEMGEGRIGLVAQHRVTMDVDDFIRELRHSGTGLDSPAHFQFKTELCASMAHEDGVIGVISVGGITKHYKYEKSMLTLIADLGSIALYNNTLFSKTQEMANCDGLTKLYNKRFFLARLSEDMLKAQQGHHPLSLFLFDLDNFKNYNDTQGHQAGDEVLKITGQILRDAVRPDDLAARYGGEEFVVILSRSSMDGAMKAAQRIREMVASHPYPNRERQPLGVVSLSGGVATYPDHGRTGTDLIAAADAALYRAKKAGRNKVFGSESKYLSDEPDEASDRASSG